MRLAQQLPSKNNMQSEKLTMINLTAPFYPYFPGGSQFPWEAPFFTEDIATYERNAARLFYISMGSETGTRLMGPGLVSPDGLKIHDFPIQSLVNRPTCVLHVKKGAGEAITAADLQNALDQGGQPQPGDAWLVATGWGDGQRWKEINSRYALETPFFSIDAAAFLLHSMQASASDLLLTDCVYLDDLAHSSHAEWLDAPGWRRPSWPSDQARVYLRDYTSQQVCQDFKITFLLLEKIWAIAGLANCGELPAGRVRLNGLPMMVQNAGEAPCTVVANRL